MPAATERELVALLAAGLAPVPVRWGWMAGEGAETPPSLPLVTVQRTLASAAPWADMCVDQHPLADTSVQVHTWHQEYEAARLLNAQVRTIVLDAGGWALQAEVDDYEGNFRAWRIAGDYLSAGLAVE
ncbi:MAG TPA: hypothetical protein VN680_02485 [Burkholderiaceae bacterium]|nr:hypothetical protein [Burkholderiaceae bacterium]